MYINVCQFISISFLFQEYFYTLITTVLYFIAFIVIMAGFGYCTGRGNGGCDARMAAGVSLFEKL